LINNFSVESLLNNGQVHKDIKILIKHSCIINRETSNL